MDPKLAKGDLAIMRQQTFARKALGLLLAALLLHVIWYLGSLWLHKSILPDPVSVYQNFPALFEKELSRHLMASLARIFAGMGIALLLGFCLGLLMGRSNTWNQVLDPIVYLTYPIPKLALLPIVMLLLGLGDASKITLIVLIVLPQVILAVRDAVRQIPADLYDIYRCLRADGWQQFRQITLPACLYAILSTSRISLGTAISVLFFTENYGTRHGMGYFIMDAWLRMDYPTMYGAILILSGLGLLLFLIIDAIGWFGMSWQRSE